tara:strand:+ start:1228 stop:1650 length:423 start_codon:yes stop_codon:yes gene_type:complete
MKLINYNQGLVHYFFDNFIYSELERRSSISNKSPDVNILEENELYILEFAVPGKTKDDFLIEIDNNILSVSLIEPKNNKTDLDLYSRREFSYNSFLRTFNLPDQLDPEKISATYLNGVLKINIPKEKLHLIDLKKIIKVE